MAYGPMVVVTWLDAQDDGSGWKEPDEVKRGILIRSVGWLLSDLPDGVTLAMDLDAEGRVNGTGFIPRGVITSTDLVNVTPSPYVSPHYSEADERSL